MRILPASSLASGARGSRFAKSITTAPSSPLVRRKSWTRRTILCCTCAGLSPGPRLGRGSSPGRRLGRGRRRLLARENEEIGRPAQQLPETLLPVPEEKGQHVSDRLRRVPGTAGGIHHRHENQVSHEAHGRPGERAGKVPEVVAWVPPAGGIALVVVVIKDA